MMLKFTASTLAALSLTAFNPVNAEAGCQPNLGYGFSEAMHDPSLGNTHWGIDDKKCFPPVHSLGSGESGTDDSVALLVGGNFLGSKGAEIEGNIVVMGDFHNTQSGPLNLVSAGEGSQITPSKNGDCLIVGGDMSSAKRMEIYYPHYQCRAVAKGAAKNSGKIAPQWMTGMGFRYESQPDLDLTKYEEQINDLRSKSLYWSSFPNTNGASTNISNDSFNFVCSDEDAIQVFNVDADLLQGSGYSQYVFTRSCNNKTILINIQGSGSVTFATKHTKWTNEDGVVQDGGWANFPSCMNSAILWNFPNVIDLTVKGYDEVQGSLLVNGNMSFETSGQSGRTMVLGDFTMNYFGSELHSYSYSPKIPLPDPNCESPEEGSEGGGEVDCNGEFIETSKITSLDFLNADVTKNELHLEGGELRYSGIGKVRDRDVDLVVTDAKGDYHNIQQFWDDRSIKEIKNGKNGQFANINLQTVEGVPKSGEGTFQFCFRDSETNDVVTVQNFRWTVYDLDQRGGGIDERMFMDTSQASSYQLWPDLESSEIDISCEDGSQLPCAAGVVRTVFHSSTHGTGQDNPTDANNMTEQQKKRSVTFTFKDTDCWTFTYDHYCPSEQIDEGGDGSACKSYTGGNFLFSGDSEEIHTEGECIVPPTPLPTDPPTEGEPSCSCGVNDPDSATFKCGKDIYICPGVDQICSVSPATGSQYFDLTQEQCEAMRSVEIGEKCVELPQHGIVGTGGPNGPKGLSHRDCYNSDFPDGAKEDGSCDVCKDSFPYTPSPTDAPTNAVTTAPPTDSPTKMTCGEKTVSDVCIAIDNSGSVCTSPGLSATLCDSCNNKCRAGGKLDDGLCCGNYGSITDFASSYVDRLPSESNFSVLKFGSDSNVISQAGSSAEDAKNAITTSRYTGGYTFTEGAIMDCVEQLKDSANPLIVVITDGTPTVCNKSNGGKAYTGKNGCNEKRCSSCSGGSFGAAAEQAADVASENGMSLIPVIISTVSTDVEQLEDLARCPANSETCDVNNYKGLSVDNLDELDTILDDLVIVSECAGEATNAPTTSPTSSPTDTPTNAPTNAPTTSPSLSPSESTPSPTKSPTTEPTPSPTMSPTAEPTNEPTSSPSSSPSKATLSPTKSPTLEPTNEPTSSPSSSPSKATLSPTMSPTLEPTLAPSAKAVETTLEPTIAATTKAPIATAGEDDDDDTIFTPPSTCPEDVKVIRTDGVTPFPESPSDVVRIVQQDVSTVTVGLHQHWTAGGDSKALSSIFYEYRENMFSSKCYEERDVEGGGQLFETITITCNVLQPRASLEICVVDDEILDPNDNGTVPKCCHEDKEDEGLESRTVCYTLDIQCKTVCVDDENDVVPARMLRGSSLKN